jgi:integrase
VLADAIGLPRRTVLDQFLVAAGLGFAFDVAGLQAAERREHRLAECNPMVAATVRDYSAAMVARQQRARRLGNRADGDRTIEKRLIVVRDFFDHLARHHPNVTGLVLVSVTEIEPFLAQRAHRPNSDLTYLRQFFTWPRRRNLIVADPTRGLRQNSKPIFTGPVLSLDTQRALFSRWTSRGNDVHPHEALAGLLALLHAARRDEIVHLQLSDIGSGTVQLGTRPAPTTLDPYTADALANVLATRPATGNPYLIVNEANRRGTRPVGDTYLTQRVRPSGTTLRAVRAARLVALATELDPIAISGVTGMDAKAILYYLSGGNAAAEQPVVPQT